MLHRQCIDVLVQVGEVCLRSSGLLKGVMCRINVLVQVDEFWIRSNGLVRDRLGYGFRFGGPIAVIVALELIRVGPHFIIL